MILGIASDIICAALMTNATLFFAYTVNAGRLFLQTIARKAVVA